MKVFLLYGLSAMAGCNPGALLLLLPPSLVRAGAPYNSLYCTGCRIQRHPVFESNDLLSKCGFATLLNPLVGRTTYVVGLEAFFSA